MCWMIELEQLQLRTDPITIAIVDTGQAKGVTHAC